MFLTQEISCCKTNQAVVLSQDSGETRKHYAYNPGGNFNLRHYKLDGELFKQSKCCDYLLVNDSCKKAYFIELKGKALDAAVVQLEAGEEKCKGELTGYSFLYRIICSKAKTHQINSTKVRKFKDKHGKRFMIKEERMEETLK